MLLAVVVETGVTIASISITTPVAITIKRNTPAAIITDTFETELPLVQKCDFSDFLANQIKGN
ncbi:hypothetical protein BCD67_02635 [Oscillatoriales cyanobacterium USR001]|nr:hypothetical protein BCD67_02635 [Oscillatoriales cyanobacterium USR001]